MEFNQPNSWVWPRKGNKWSTSAYAPDRFKPKTTSGYGRSSTPWSSPLAQTKNPFSAQARMWNLSPLHGGVTPRALSGDRYNFTDRDQPFKIVPPTLGESLGGSAVDPANPVPELLQLTPYPESSFNYNPGQFSDAGIREQARKMAEARLQEIISANTQAEQAAIRDYEASAKALAMAEGLGSSDLASKEEADIARLQNLAASSGMDMGQGAVENQMNKQGEWARALGEFQAEIAAQRGGIDADRMNVLNEIRAASQAARAGLPGTVEELYQAIRGNRFQEWDSTENRRLGAAQSSAEARANSLAKAWEARNANTLAENEWTMGNRMTDGDKWQMFLSAMPNMINVRTGAPDIAAMKQIAMALGIDLDITD